jgi:hypothetical protein
MTRPQSFPLFYALATGEKLLSANFKHCQEVDHHINIQRLVDLGQRSAMGSANPLVVMMPGEQAAWLHKRLRELDIPVKVVLGEQEIRQDLSKCVEQLVLGRLMEHVKVDWAKLFRDLDLELRMTETMIKQQVDVKVRERLSADGCMDAYDMIIEQAVLEHFALMMQKKETLLHKLIGNVRLVRQSQ